MLKKLSILVVILLVVCAAGYAQCAMCAASIETGLQEGNQTGTGLNTGILYLMAFPYILLGTIGFLWYRQHKKRQQIEQ